MGCKMGHLQASKRVMLGILLSGLILWKDIHASMPIKGKDFLQVKTPLHPCVEDSIINQALNTYGFSTIKCASLCASTPTCQLACSKEVTCKLFRANVTQHYKGHSDPDDVLDGYKCFSSFANTKDISNQANVEGSDLNDGSLATDGLFCEHSGLVLHTKSVNKAFIQLEFPASRSISQINIRTQNASSGVTFFEDVEIRVGDNPMESGNSFKKNKLFARYPNGKNAPLGLFLEYKKSPPLKGKFVSVQKMSASPYGQKNIAFEDIQIIEA